MASPKRRILKANSLETQRSSARLICTAWNPFSNMFRSFKEAWNEVMTGRYSSCFTEVENPSGWSKLDPIPLKRCKLWRKGPTWRCRLNSESGEITQLLAKMKLGNPDAEARLFSVI